MIENISTPLDVTVDIVLGFKEMLKQVQHDK